MVLVAPLRADTSSSFTSTVNSNPVNLHQDRSVWMPRQAYTLPENLFLDFMEYLGGQVAREGFLKGQF